MNDLREQIGRLQGDIARQEAEMAELEASLLDLQREFSDFMRRYDRLIQPLTNRLEIIRGVIADLEMQSRLPPPQPAARPLPYETFSSLPPDHVPVEEQFRRTWRVPRQKAEAELPPLPRRPEDVIEADHDPKGALKRLYRQLVRRYHPDLSTDPEERERRNRLMAEINDAYSRQDAHALQLLADQPEHASAGQPLAAIQVRQFEQVREQLAHRITRLKQERDDFLNSDMMWLKIQESLVRKKGRDLLREMADQLESEYAACLDRLDELRRMSG
jgi:septal ring factor EnvC (AmiA/AmiB activator)